MNQKPQADFEIGGGWGDSIQWNGVEQFESNPVSIGSGVRYGCHGWKMTKPKVGQTLVSEFVRSWMVFEFVEVNPCRDPRDMFFGLVEARAAIAKATGGTK